MPCSGGKSCVQDRGSPCSLVSTDRACSDPGGVQTQRRGVNAQGMPKAGPVPRALAGMETSTQKKPAPSHPQSSEWVERQQEILHDSYAGRLSGQERWWGRQWPQHKQRSTAGRYQQPPRKKLPSIWKPRRGQRDGEPRGVADVRCFS